MLKKLFKYEAISMNKFIMIFGILSLLFAILTRIFFEIPQTTAVIIIGRICMGTMIAMMFNIIINCIMRNFVRFKENLYGDESYLTHTLPVSKNKIFLSKFLIALELMLVSFMVIIISLFIAFYSKENMEIIKQIINDSMQNMQNNIIPIIVGAIVILFLELFTLQLSGFLGIILGHKKNNGKILWSLIYGFLVYIINQIIVIAGIFILGIINKDIMEIFISDTLDINIIKTIMIYSLIIYIAVIGILYKISTKQLSKGVNVD